MQVTHTATHYEHKLKCCPSFSQINPSQVSGALIRLSQNVKPTPLDLDMDKYSTYTDNGKWTQRAIVIMPVSCVM